MVIETNKYSVLYILLLMLVTKYIFIVIINILID